MATNHIIKSHRKSRNKLTSLQPHCGEGVGAFATTSSKSERRRQRRAILLGTAGHKDGRKGSNSTRNYKANTLNHFNHFGHMQFNPDETAKDQVGQQSPSLRLIFVRIESP